MAPSATARAARGPLFARSIVRTKGSRGVRPPAGAAPRAASAAERLLSAGVGCPLGQPGWTVGAGIEYAFADMWTAKIEYLFVDFGKIDWLIMRLNMPPAGLLQHVIHNLDQVR
jgi:hypothetical protein